MVWDRKGKSKQTNWLEDKLFSLLIPFFGNCFSRSMCLWVPHTAVEGTERTAGDSTAPRCRCSGQRQGWAAEALSSSTCPPATQRQSLSFWLRADLLPLSSFSKRKLCILDSKSLSALKLTETINLRYWLHRYLTPCPWTVLTWTWFVFIRSPDAKEKQRQEHKL